MLPEHERQYLGIDRESGSNPGVRLRGARQEMMLTAEEFVDWRSSYWLSDISFLFRRISNTRTPTVEIYIPALGERPITTDNAPL
jgi:hypothetical protein